MSKVSFVQCFAAILIPILLLFGCGKNKEEKEEIPEAKITGKWRLIENEGKIVNTNEDKEITIVINPDHTSGLFENTRQKHQGGWALFKEGNVTKFLLHDAITIIEIKDDQLTISPVRTDNNNPHKGKYIWKKIE